MRPPSGWVTELFGRIMRHRNRLPGPVNRLIDSVARNPDGVAGRVASALLGGGIGVGAPLPTTVPDASIRVYIGPTNYAGQGRLWAEALALSGETIGAANMAVQLPGGFAFPADSLVPIGVYNRSKRWQRAELAAVEQFTHVLIEAERPLFGSLFDRDVATEVRELQRRSLSCAFMCHGTDIRSPRNHMARNRWSPYFDDAAHTQALQHDADRNLDLLRTQGIPVFVSTPDLLIDVPEATWCPVVIDPARWIGGRPLATDRVPVVLHVPSMNSVKGTHLIEPMLRKLHEAGSIEYRRVTGVASSRMPGIVGDADIVLDQFRIGSYGVAACEAMAAGRVVVGAVEPEVRKAVRDVSGLALPVVEADPATLEAVLERLIVTRAEMARIGQEGVEFVAKVHAGSASVSALRERWIDGHGPSESMP